MDSLQPVPDFENENSKLVLRHYILDSPSIWSNAFDKLVDNHLFISVTLFLGTHSAAYTMYRVYAFVLFAKYCASSKISASAQYVNCLIQSLSYFKYTANS